MYAMIVMLIGLFGDADPIGAGAHATGEAASGVRALPNSSFTARLLKKYSHHPPSAASNP
jgi:hypothetical protein